MIIYQQKRKQVRLVDHRGEVDNFDSPSTQDIDLAIEVGHIVSNGE